MLATVKTLSTARYAVYFAPVYEAAFWTAAQHWLGRDCITGQPLSPGPVHGLDQGEIAKATESPRHYGFHGTLKAPFRLAEGCTLDGLRTATARLAASQAAFLAPPLEVTALGPFLAMTLSAPSPAMSGLADACVRDLDDLRAPLKEADLARRLAAGLSERQEAHLRRWGYPYVFEEFRFHMTLTGRLDEELRHRLKTVLAERFRAHVQSPLPVREIALYEQPLPEEPFLLVERFALTGQTAAHPDAGLQDPETLSSGSPA